LILSINKEKGQPYQIAVLAFYYSW